MFIYKITILPINQSYIGLDTSPTYKLARWKIHQRESKGRCKTKLHKAMSEHGIDNCIIEIIASEFKSLSELAIAEINYIKLFDTYENGLNSTPGGDGLGKHDLTQLSSSDFQKIKESLGDHFKNYNKTIKWANTTITERKEMMSHLFTEEVYHKKSNTLKEFYKNNPEIAMSKSIGIKKWQSENLEKLKEQNTINSLKGIAKTSKKLRIEKIDGTIEYFCSKSEFQRKTGQWAVTVLKKTKSGEFHNGYKAFELS